MIPDAMPRAGVAWMAQYGRDGMAWHDQNITPTTAASDSVRYLTVKGLGPTGIRGWQSILQQFDSLDYVCSTHIL